MLDKLYILSARFIISSNIFLQNYQDEFWPSFKAFLGNNFPDYLAEILIASGYETALAVQLLNPNNIKDLEVYVHENLRHLLRNTTYVKNSAEFHFPPGHRSLLLNLPDQIQKFQQAKSLSPMQEKEWNLNEFSFVLKSLIETAQSNLNRNSNQHRYSESIRNFATYIYLMCGKACYETLSANLPIPLAGTIREFNMEARNHGIHSFILFSL